MKIYTKKGDTGSTSLFGGKRVPKSDLRIESYGTVDELNSFLGLIRDQADDDDLVQVLLDIQERLFTIGSSLAADPDKKNLVTPDIQQKDLHLLEDTIDHMEKELPELKNFILPGGNVVSSYCHVARCVCRRAERQVVKLAALEEVPSEIIQYLNRLSDFLFVTARKVLMDQGGQEIAWKPRS